MGVGRSQLVHRRVTHGQKYGLMIIIKNNDNTTDFEKFSQGILKGEVSLYH
jgi:hypothetical protein